MAKIDIEKIYNECAEWVEKWWEENGGQGPAVIGISGGKDSSVAAALLTRVLGKDHVFGVLMPNGTQKDINYAIDLVTYLDLAYAVVNINPATAVLNDIVTAHGRMEMTEQAYINLPARVRMTVLYGFSQNLDGRVVNTCNYSEDYIGYSTKYGDAAGDFSPLGGLTVQEVKALGEFLGLPDVFIDKTPSDGLCGQTDEEKLGFTYKMLDAYIRDGVEPPEPIKNVIDSMHERNKFKLEPIATFKPTLVEE